MRALLIACVAFGMGIGMSTTTFAQHHEHSVAPKRYTPMDHYFPQAPLFLLPNAAHTQNATAKPKLPPEKRFSWWGHRHDELHSTGAIAELLRKTKGSCCDGEDSGECRVSRFVGDGVRAFVLIDDQICPVTKETKIANLVSFREQGSVVLCAGKTSEYLYDGRMVRTCPSTYCIGVPSDGG